VQNALIANDRVNSTFLSFPDLRRIVCFFPGIGVSNISRKNVKLYIPIIYEIMEGLSREIFSHPNPLFLLKLRHIDVSHCFY